MKKILFISFIFISNLVFAQTAQELRDRFIIYTDSLKKLLETMPADTNRVLILNAIGGAYFTVNPELCKKYGEEAFQLSETLAYNRGVGQACRALGNIYRIQGNYAQAVRYLTYGIRVYEEMKDKAGVGTLTNNMGRLYASQNNNEKALEYYAKSLAIFKEINLRERIASALNNIGEVYMQQNQDSLALDYIHQALKINHEKGNKRLEDLQIRQQEVNLYNIGTIFAKQEKFEQAIDSINKSLEISLRLNHLEYIAKNSISLADIYVKQKQLQKAINYYKQALDSSQNHGLKETVKVASFGLSNIHENLKDYAKAFEFYKIYTITKDSLEGEETEKKVAILQNDIENTKKQAQIELLERDKKIREEELEMKDLQNNFAIGVAIFFIILVAFMFRSNQQRKKTNEQLSLQKAEIEKKNEDITASINYAKRIQTAMLPSADELAKYFPDSFVFFKPRDIVSGDFYWFSQVRNPQTIDNQTILNEKLILAVADCTGHGVPGAFMSMIGNDILNEIVNTKNITQADKILNELHKGIQKALKQEETESRDGMDVAILVIDCSKQKAEYAGAMNPLFYVQNKQFFEIKADKKAIGGRQAEAVRTFNKHEIDISTETTFYLCSDGFQDQFGGENNQKFMVKKLKSLIFDIHSQHLCDQKDILEKTINEWKGTRKQIDDMLIFAVKV